MKTRKRNKENYAIVRTRSGSSALWNIWEEERLRSKPCRNPGGAPKAVHCEHDYLPTAPVVKLVPNILLCSPLDYISEAERWILTTGHPSLPNTGGSSYGSYVQAYWRRSMRYRLPPTVGGIIASHRSATTRLKLGTLQPVRLGRHSLPASLRA